MPYDTLPARLSHWFAGPHPADGTESSAAAIQSRAVPSAAAAQETSSSNGESDGEANPFFLSFILFQ